MYSNPTHFTRFWLRTSTSTRRAASSFGMCSVDPDIVTVNDITPAGVTSSSSGKAFCLPLVIVLY